MDDQLGVRPKNFLSSWTFHYTAAVLARNRRLTMQSLALNSYKKEVRRGIFLLALGINMATHDKALLALVTPRVGRSHLTLRVCTLVPFKKNYRYSQ